MVPHIEAAFPRWTVLRHVHTSNSMRIRSVHTQSALSETGFEPVRSQTTSVGGFDQVDYTCAQ